MVPERLTILQRGKVVIISRRQWPREARVVQPNNLKLRCNDCRLKHSFIKPSDTCGIMKNFSSGVCDFCIFKGQGMVTRRFMRVRYGCPGPDTQARPPRGLEGILELFRPLWRYCVHIGPSVINHGFRVYTKTCVPHT